MTPILSAAAAVTGREPDTVVSLCGEVMLAVGGMVSPARPERVVPSTPDVCEEVFPAASYAEIV